MAASRLSTSCLKVVLLTASCSSALSGSEEVRVQSSEFTGVKLVSLDFTSL